MTDRRKQSIHRGIAGLLVISMVLSASLWNGFPALASSSESSDTEQTVQEKTSGEVSAASEDDAVEGDDVVALEGISLNKSNLVMQTGETATLKASLLPSDVTESPEIVWSTDDEQVACVRGDGLDATVTAPEGAGGTATITVQAGEYTAQCYVLVTVSDPMLESVIFMQNSSGSNKYQLTELGGREYTLRVPESTNVIYVRPQLRDDLSSDATITARFTDAYTGEEVTVDLPVDETTSLSNSKTGRLIKAYNTEQKKLYIEVKDGERTESYTYYVRRGTYLGGFTLTDNNGQSVEYSPSFQKTSYNYSVHVSSSITQLTVQMTAAEESNTVLTVNGETAENGSYVLPLTGNKVKAVLRAGDGKESLPFEYVLTVYVDESCYLTAKTEPTDALVSIFDENKVQIDPVDGKYELIKGGTYTYTVSASGYKTLNGSFTIEEDQEMSFQLEKSSESQYEELDAEWGGYWKNNDNQNVVDAQTPSSLESAALAWSQKYGDSANETNSISDGILVGDYLCCFQGNKLLYLNKETGEEVKSTQMAGKGNSSFNKPLYAAGMIFVPLNNGRVQAFNAKTLDSLWIYMDTVGGAAATALRYDSGYLYAGFMDGNLACISIEDEEPMQTDESKSAIWRKYDSEGFYRSGVYTNDNYVYACGRSGTLYCLDKKTGSTIQQIKLSEEVGTPSTAISYYDSRIFFATENGYLLSYEMDAKGKLLTDKTSVIRLGGVIYGTPLVYNGRVYVGSGAKDVYGVIQSPYYINVVQIGEDGSLTLAYRMQIGGCPKGSGTLTTAYESVDGYVYVYYTTDSKNGEIYLLKDKAGATEAGDGNGLFYQQSEVSGNGGSSIVVDKEGNLYFRYESAWMYKLQSSRLYLKDVKLTGADGVMDGGSSLDGQAENHELVLAPGTERVTLTFEVDEETTVTVNGTQGSTQDIVLTDGKAELTVVLSKGEASRQYQIQLRCQSTDASLEVLQVSYSPMVSVMEQEMKPAFQKDVTNYSAMMGGNTKNELTSFYVWPVLPEGSKSTLKVTVSSGVSSKRPGDEIEGMTVYIGSGERLRYRVDPSDKTGTLLNASVDITVTAEDGITQKVYHLEMGRDNSVPKISAGSDALISREEKQVTIRINAAIDGYLYYLPEKKKKTEGMPTAAEIKVQGRRVAIEAGDNTLTLDGISDEESILYLYEMSYAQRFSNGILIEIPAYTGDVDPPVSDKGDINGDGSINLSDVIALLNAVTEEKEISAEQADINGDGTVDLSDVIALLNQATASG